MAKYDLTNSLETSFTFAIGDKEFSFRKPTVREMRALSKKFADIKAEEDQEKQAQQSEEAMNELYSFVVPINHDTSVSELIDDQPIDVQNAFNKMVLAELGAQ